MPTKPEKTAAAVAPEKSLGARVKEKREELGINFEEFAALTREYDPEGIAAVTLRRYEREGDAVTLPGLRELRILCDTLDVSADYLLRGHVAPDYVTQDRADWEAFKEIIARATKAERIPGIEGPDPYAKFARQEALKRARLHTKNKDGKSV